MNKFSKLFSNSSRHYLSYNNSRKVGKTGLSSELKAHHYSTSSILKVTVLGAGGNVGKLVSLMLKQSPYIDELCLYDSLALHGFASDLNYIDTKCKVTSYFGGKDIQQAVSNSHIILVLAYCHHSDNCSYNNVFDRNAPTVKDIAVNIAKYSPKSLIAIGAEPINSIVPMFSEIMKRHGHYNPQAIFGITTIDVVRTNRFVADILGLEPECVLVPVIGGHTEKTIVPVLSQASPCNELTNEELEDITNSVRKAEDNLFKVRSEGPYMSSSFAMARFIISLVKAVRGQSEITECAYVKSGIHPQLKYMVTPLLLGPGGISKNLGIPKLSDYEMCLLDNAIPLLTEDIKKGEFVGGRPMDIVDGELQDKPLCDPCDPNPKAPRCPPNHCELESLFVDKQ